MFDSPSFLYVMSSLPTIMFRNFGEKEPSKVEYGSAVRGGGRVRSFLIRFVGLRV